MRVGGEDANNNKRTHAQEKIENFDIGGKA